MKHQSTDRNIDGRRRFLEGLISGTALMVAGCGQRHSTESGDVESTPMSHEEEVSPAEDLMREHGVLKRILLIYGEALRRIEAGEELLPQTLPDCAKIVRSFIENYHEKLEEDFLFPRFRKANRLVDLVDVLTEQHQPDFRYWRGIDLLSCLFSTKAYKRSPLQTFHRAAQETVPSCVTLGFG